MCGLIRCVVTSFFSDFKDILTREVLAEIVKQHKFELESKDDAIEKDSEDSGTPDEVQDFNVSLKMEANLEGYVHYEKMSNDKLVDLCRGNPWSII